MIQIAILDDYQGVALNMADWSVLPENVELKVFRKHLGNSDKVAAALAAYSIICIMRERTPFPRALFEQLPNLKLLITTGAQNAAIDLDAARDHGVTVCGTHSPGHAAAELAWGLILALTRQIVEEDRAMRTGLWQTTIGTDLRGQTLGIIGLGRHGANVASFAKAFGMNVIAWSQNLTEERCAELGVTHVTKEMLLAQADIITIHLKMGKRYRNLIGAQELELMKPSAYLVNTSRGPIIQEHELIKALQAGRIAGAGLDVYENEPLPSDHPLRSLANTVLTSHVGFVTEQTYRIFYADTVAAIQAWLDGSPIGVLN